jgi:hypothetical protein
MLPTMNIQRWKGILWLGSTAVGALLAYRVYDFWRQRDELAKEITNEEIEGVLDSVKKPPEQKTDVVDYSAIQGVFHTHDWTGKPPAKPEVAKADTGNQSAPRVAVATLLRVMAIKVDTAHPEESRAYVRYQDQKLAAHTGREDTILRPEKRLFAPYQDIRVQAISAAGVTFAFDDAVREPETVPVSPYISAQRGEIGIVLVGPEGAILPQLQRRIQANADLPPWNPEEITQIRKNEWQVGTRTLEDLDRDYSRILSSDVRVQTHKSPRNGSVEGIKILHVAPDSIPARAGLTEGEVLKSINGHKVTSVNDAIAFVKANANSTETWVAVFERQGREFTRTYHSPAR